MKKEILLKKIKLIEALHIQKCLDRANKNQNKFGYRSANYDGSIDGFDAMLRSGLAVHYAPRLGIFKDYNGHLTFDPQTMIGRSYQWYLLTAKVKGTVILNTFGYSRQTSQHVGAMRDLLKQLGIRFKEVEAPSGLQNLSAAAQHAQMVLAALNVKRKHSRDGKCTNLERRAEVLSHIKTLKKLGYSCTKQQIDAFNRFAVDARNRRLERQRLKREFQRRCAAVTVIEDPNNIRGRDAGLHVYYPYGLSGRALERERENAVREGFTQIFVHNSRFAIVEGA